MNQHALGINIVALMTGVHVDPRFLRYAGCEWEEVGNVVACDGGDGALFLKFYSAVLTLPCKQIQCSKFLIG